jgi:hypothetical protein
MHANCCSFLQVVGLTWGFTSILCLWLRTLLTGAAPPVDLQLSEKKKKAA